MPMPLDENEITEPKQWLHTDSDLIVDWHFNAEDQLWVEVSSGYVMAGFFMTRDGAVMFARDIIDQFGGTDG